MIVKVGDKYIDLSQVVAIGEMYVSPYGHSTFDVICRLLGDPISVRLNALPGEQVKERPSRAMSSNYDRYNPETSPDFARRHFKIHQALLRSWSKHDRPRDVVDIEALVSTEVPTAEDRRYIIDQPGAHIKFDMYGNCYASVSECPYTKECAQHSSAGDYRSESGFSPHVSATYEDLDDASVIRKCYTCKVVPAEQTEYYDSITPNDDTLGMGMINLRVKR